MSHDQSILTQRDQSYVPPFIKELNSQAQNKLALFDADGTLWRNDVADDFTKWFLNYKKPPSASKWQEYLDLYKRDHAAGCRFLLSFYQGFTIKEFWELNQKWWKEEADRNWIPEVVESLFWLSEKGYEIWVVTGSPTDALLPITKMLPVAKVVGMDFELDNDDIITGQLQGISCADQGKADKVRSLITNQEVIFSAGNSQLDFDLIELASHVKWCIHPNAEFQQVAQKQGWHILERPSDFVEETKLAD